MVQHEKAHAPIEQDKWERTCQVVLHDTQVFVGEGAVTNHICDQFVIVDDHVRVASRGQYEVVGYWHLHRGRHNWKARLYWDWRCDGNRRCVLGAPYAVSRSLQVALRGRRAWIEILKYQFLR
jgi:hypothetical protein